MTKKHDVNEINLEIENVTFWSPHENNKGGMRIYWSSDIGFGTLDVFKTKGNHPYDSETSEEDMELCVDTECMDLQDDKTFTSKLMSLLVEKLQVIG